MESERTKDLLAKLTTDPEDWEYRTMAAEALLEDGHPGEAVALLDAAPNPPEYERHVLKATEVYNLVDPSKAVPVLHAFLLENPQAALVHMAMAETASKLGDFHGAGLYYNCAVTINPAYRDSDFEAVFNVEVEKKGQELDAARTMTVPVSALPQPYKGPYAAPPAPSEAQADTSPVPVQSEPPLDLPSAAQEEEPVIPAEPVAETPVKQPAKKKVAKKASSKRRAPRSSTNWLVTSLVAGGVFVSCWVIVLLVLQIMFAK